ncbi:MAG: hypothetical protein AABO57_10715 [Acidobacteriota bacterium]
MRRASAPDKADRQDHWGSNYEDSYAYRDTNYGYSGYYVERDDYNYYFREGFRRGYEDGYNSRYQWPPLEWQVCHSGRHFGYNPHLGGASLKNVSGPERRFPPEEGANAASSGCGQANV